MAKKARVYDGTAWQELASAQTDLTAYSTTAQMNTAITAGVGLVPILTQTIGTAVSSVVVSNAFSATYDNYEIIVSGGASSATTVLGMKLGAAATGYYASGRYVGWDGSLDNIVNNNSTSWSTLAGQAHADGLFSHIFLNSPFLAKRTRIESTYLDNTGSARVSGYLNGTTSYTDFTLTPASGTLTGGTIRVYGYKN